MAFYNKTAGVLMKKIFGYLSLISLATVFAVSCTALKSTGNSVGRSVGSVFKTPAKVENKITNPARNDAHLSVLWIGHASVLIQIDDKFILTDPVFSETVAMLSKRLVEPGIEPENLPPIDVALISHMHVDHLSFGSLEMIEDKIERLVVPENGLQYIPNFNFKLFELKRDSSINFDGLKITSAPAVHNGWRYGFDALFGNKSYTAYVIDYRGIRVYFGGDTAYDSTLFKKTGERFPGIDLALLPIAPIHPREYSKAHHAGPAEALKIFEDLRAEKFIPIHYDTFPESYDTLGEAPLLLKKLTEEKNISENRVVFLKIGEQKVIIPKEK